MKKRAGRYVLLRGYDAIPFGKFKNQSDNIMFFKRNRKRVGRDHRNTVTAFKNMLDVPVGGNAVIRQHHSVGAVRQRLLALGFVPGREVQVLRVATLGCPLELKVSGYCVTLRRREARQIEVE